MSLTLEVIKIYQRVKYIYIYTRVYLGNPWVLVIGKKKKNHSNKILDEERKTLNQWTRLCKGK